MGQTPATFAEALDRLSLSDAEPVNGIEDAASQVSYRELPALFADLDARLDRAEVAAGECVAFACRSTAPALVVLLALLRRGQRLLLLPPRDAAAQRPGIEPEIPAFCRFALGIAEGEAKAEPIIDRLWIDRRRGWEAMPPTEPARGAPPYLLLRTSGSMGDAKMVRFSHRNLLGNARNCLARLGLTRHSRVAVAVPFCHLYGLGAGVLPALLSGARIHVQADTNILSFMDTDRRFDPDVVYLNPTLAAMLLARRRNDRAYARTISAGAALAPALFREYRARFGPMTNLYGSTEMGAAATSIAAGGDDRPERLVPLSGVQFLLDADGHLRCLHPYGFDGYVTARGESVPAGPGPFGTGDIATQSADGSIEILGRKGRSTNRAGHLVQLSAVERALMATGKVEQAVVLLGRRETVRGTKLYALCVPKQTGAAPQASEEAIRHACFELLPRYAVPDEVILRDALPVGASGKIDHRSLEDELPD